MWGKGGAWRTGTTPILVRRSFPLLASRHCRLRVIAGARSVASPFDVCHRSQTALRPRLTTAFETIPRPWTFAGRELAVFRANTTVSKTTSSGRVRLHFCRHAGDLQTDQTHSHHRDPASGTIPTGHLIWNVTDGAVRRHAGAYSWEITIGASASAKVGFHGAAPTAQRANANQATATHLAMVITLANELRAALVEKGIIKGSA